MILANILYAFVMHVSQKSEKSCINQIKYIVTVNTTRQQYDSFAALKNSFGPSVGFVNGRQWLT